MTARQTGSERDALLGLAAEWEEAVSRLPPALRARLRRPQFSLCDAVARLGAWDGARGEIRVSRGFALGSGWDEVRELLRHEAAHQVADEALGGRGQTAHGPAFREACRLLGADPAAAGEFVPLADRVAGETDPRQARTLARVRKLLALAASSNRHEAELALLRAREYARRNRVEIPGEGRGLVERLRGGAGAAALPRRVPAGLARDRRLGGLRHLGAGVGARARAAWGPRWRSAARRRRCGSRGTRTSSCAATSGPSGRATTPAGGSARGGGRTSPAA